MSGTSCKVKGAAHPAVFRNANKAAAGTASSKRRLAPVMLAALMILLLLGACTADSQSRQYTYASSDPNSLYYTNPVALERADPWIYEHSDGYYYMMASVPEYDRLELRRATTMTGLATAEPVTVWEKSESGIMSKNLWAPEIYHIDGKWYIYFSAARADREFDHRMYVLENDSANPLEGEWELKGQIRTGYEVFQIDASLFEHKGIWYLMWSGAGTKGNTLYMAQMENPWTLSSSRIKLAEPEYEWEQRAVVHVTEGPEVIKYGERIYLTYSASFCDANYNMGLLSAHVDSDLMNPESWQKSAEPIFASNPQSNAYGPGHGSFLVSRDGSERIHVYHGVDGVGTGFGCDKARNVRLQPYTFDSNGELQLGEPVSRGYTLPTPSGEARFELERYWTGDESARIAEQAFSGGAAIAVSKRSQSVEVKDIRAPETGVYALTLAYRNDGKATEQSLSINGNKFGFKLEGQIMYDTSSMIVELQGGANTIVLQAESEAIKLDYVELSYVDLAASEAEIVSGLALSRTERLQALAANAQTQLAEQRVQLPQGNYVIAVAYRNAASDARLALRVNGEVHELELASSTESVANSSGQWQYSSINLALSGEVTLLPEREGEVELAFIRMIAAPPEDVELRFINRQTGIAMQPNNGSKKAGEGYRQYFITATPAQQWMIERAEDGSYYIKNMISGLYMTAEGDGALQRELVHSEEQRWLLQYAADGSYRLVNAVTGKAPTASEADPNYYENLSFAAVDGSDAQVWYVTHSK